MEAAPDPLGDPVPRQALRDRQRRRDRPARADRRARHPALARGGRERAAGVGQRPPDHALPHAAGLGRRGETREPADRDHPPGHRALLRRQGREARDPRPGPARREDPEEEDRRGDGAQAPLAAPLREGPRARPAHHDRGIPDLRPPPRAAHRRHLQADVAAARRGRHGDPRGRPGGDARHRPRHLSVRDLLQPAGRGRLRGQRHRAEGDRGGVGRVQGLHHPGRRGAVPERAARRHRRAAAQPRRRVRHDHRPRPADRLAGPGGAALRRPPEHA